MNAADQPARVSRPWPPTLRVLAGLNLAAFGVLTVAYSVYLWPQWRHDPDLSQGLFMPLVFVLLLWEARRSTPQRHPRAGWPALAGVVALAAAALVSLTLAGLFAVSLGWTHSLVSFMLAVALSAALLAGVAAFSQAPLRVLPLNWVSFCAAALWLLAAPLPPGTYTRLTLELQSWVTGHVLTALHVLGVAARRQGNLIELATTTVGIEEACSGIRSLLACVYAGVFFSALMVRRPWARVLLVALAAPLAIGMNFVRSLTLTLLANAGVNINGFWHDATGYAIQGVTAIVLAGLALLLETRGADPTAAAPPEGAPHASRFSVATQSALAGCLVIAIGISGFFLAHTRPVRAAGNPPNLEALLPAAPPGWRMENAGNLYRFADTLQTHDLAQRTYYRGQGAGLTQITVYLAYWAPGQASVSTVAVHTPDACWPGVGWRAVATPVTRFTPVIGSQKLPAAEHRLFVNQGYPQNVWFWHLYDGTPVTQRDPRSPRELLLIALHYGFRKNGDQLFVRVSSNRAWSEIASEPLLENLFARLKPFGL